MPDPELLKRIRQEIYYNYKDFDKILKSKDFKKYFNGIDDYYKAKLVPRDYPADFEGIDILKNKSYTVSAALDEKTLHSDSLFKTTVTICKALLPYNDFLRKAV